jgi:AraC-like DNA-binding protein
MYRILEVSGLKRLIALLEILELLAETPDYRLISVPGITGHNAFESERLDAIFQYILQHFDQPIRLEEVASRVHMTRSSLCRFFRDHTKKSFSDFLIDVRLGHASTLLVESTDSVTQVAFKCGYNNLSNFNRQFKRKFGLTPRQYREAYYLRS